MRWKLFGLVVLFQSLLLAVNMPLHSAAPGPVQVVVAETSLQEPSASVYQLTLDPSIAFEHLHILGPNSGFFKINQTSLMISNTDAVPPGSYSLDIIIVLQDPTAATQLFVPFRVDVTPEASRACELQLFGRCSQSCVLDTSTYGYACTCAEGYILQQDQVTCLVFDPLPSLLARTDDGVTRVDLLTQQNTPVTLNGTVDFFDYLYRDNKMYYVDNARGVVNTVSLGSGEESLFLSHGPETVYGLVVNWVDRTLLYATDSAVVEVNIETRVSRTIHTSVSRARHLLVYANTTQRVLFWTEERGSSFVIRRCVLNGGVPEDVHTSPAEPLDLSVDLVNGDLYWVTEGGVCSSDLNGGSLNCFQCCSGAVPSGLVVFEVYIYISLRTNNSVVQIEKMRTDNPTQVVYSDIAHASDLVMVHPLKQPFTTQERDGCESCDQLCVVGVDSVRCDCSSGYRLSSDGTSCYIDEISNIVFALTFQGTRSVIKVAPTGREIERLVDASFGPSGDPVTGLVFALDYDRENSVVFYGDRDSCTLWRVSLNRLYPSQDDRQLLVSGVCAWDLAFDWISRTIYWSDDRNGTIGMASISTTGEVSSSTLELVTGINQSRGLDIDPASRQLYWVDSGTNSIWRIGVDSLLPRVLVTDLSRPSDLAIDHQTRRLYWSELSGRIVRSDLNGTNQEVVYSDPSATPFKIALYKKYLLWIDGTSGSFNVIHRENTDNRGSVPIVPPPSPTQSLVLNGLLVVGSNRQLSLGTYQCVQNVPGCSHYCNADDEDTASCSCPVGYSLSGGTTCTYEGVCPECTGGGSCMVQGSTISCSCPPGFMGQACNQSCAEGTFGEGCAQQCNCLNGGDCNPVNGTCNCTQGYEGANCGQAICTEDCQNGGTCTQPDFCSCVPTYGGPTCNLRVCTSDYCLNGGTCTENFGVDLSCTCPSNTNGLRCQFEDIILFPQSGERLAASVGAPIGVLFALILVVIVVGAGIYYYVKCVPHRKTNPLENQTELPPARKYVSPEPSEADNAGTTRNSNFTDHSPESSYHIYVET